MPELPRIVWQPIATAPKCSYILVACKSGYVTTPWVYYVAIYSEGYNDRWDDYADAALMDSRHIPEYWSPLPNHPA